MNEIATYAFNRWLSTRTFLLFTDRVTVKTSSRFVEWIRETQPFALKGLMPVPVRGEMRLPGFATGIASCLGGLGLTSAWLLSGGLELPGKARIFPFVTSAIGLAGLLSALCSTRRWHYARFYSEVGGLVFTLQCPPEDTRVLEEFINAITNQIKALDHTG